jgi:hypothetical protein
MPIGRKPDATSEALRSAMAHDRETLWTAEANRWNIGKLILGVLFAVFVLKMMLSLIILAGPVNFPGTYPAIEADPLVSALWYAGLALLSGLAFGWLEGRRQRARPA